MKMLTIFLFLFFASFSAMAGKTAFVAGFEDLPLMPGMVQTNEDSVSFDAPSGRFVEVLLETEKADRRAVETFYEKALPPLGWEKKQTGSKTFSFMREGEMLVFTVDGNTVRIELKTP